jgi:hypothetical protein
MKANAWAKVMSRYNGARFADFPEIIIYGQPINSGNQATEFPPHSP